MMNQEDREATEFRRQQLEDEIAQSLKDMADLVPTIKGEAIRYATSWAIGALEQVAMEQGDHALELGIERLRQLSCDIKAAAKGFPELLTQKLEDAPFWSHRNGQLDHMQPADKLPPWERFITPLDALGDLMAEAMVPVARLLDGAGFKAPAGSRWIRRNSANTRDIWGGWSSPARGALDEIVGEYHRAHNQILGKIRSLHNVRAKLQRDDVERMLDQIRDNGAS
jgi:hypothetical protein